MKKTAKNLEAHKKPTNTSSGIHSKESPKQAVLYGIATPSPPVTTYFLIHNSFARLT